MRVGIALGSNVGDRLAFLTHARHSILRSVGVSGPCFSSNLYETEPVDSSADAPPFLNAVIEVTFAGTPQELLPMLQDTEASMGRPPVRERNAPRAIDLDILYAEAFILETPSLCIPHPRLHLRRFVLTPLNDIRPELVLPNQSETVSELLASLSDPAAVLLSESQWSRFP